MSHAFISKYFISKICKHFNTDQFQVVSFEIIQNFCSFGQTAFELCFKNYRLQDTKFKNKIYIYIYRSKLKNWDAWILKHIDFKFHFKVKCRMYVWNKRQMASHGKCRRCISFTPTHSSFNARCSIVLSFKKKNLKNLKKNPSQ